MASPDGKHLLWYTQKGNVSILEAWLQRWYPRWHRKTPRIFTCYLSDMHGNGLREIWSETIEPHQTLLPEWTPDSKHLSFIYQEQLYLLPID